MKTLFKIDWEDVRMKENSKQLCLTKEVLSLVRPLVNLTNNKTQSAEVGKV